MQKTFLGIFRHPTYQDLNFLGDFRLYSFFHLKNTQTPIFLGLTSKYLLYFENEKQKTPTGLCELTFDLKFEILREAPWNNQFTPGKPVGIRFQKEIGPKQYQTLEIYYQHDRLIDAWRQDLERLLNQRNFHSLFKAKRKIGKGAFATVYLAERLLDKKLVAVKAFSKERQYAGEKGKESLINEINLMRMVSHENVMKLEGVYETENSIYVILQLLQGCQLYERLKNKQIKEQCDIKKIIWSILSGLKALAEKNIIHRDLKPENVMFRTENEFDLVICDFGLATKADEDKYLFVRCGTPGFVAPEIINIRDMKKKSETVSDIFSAGLIFHLLLFGKSIFEGSRYNQILAENRACSFNFQKQIYSLIDPLALDLLKKLLEINPKERISADKALMHPYFESQNTISHETTMIDEKFENITNYSSRNKPRLEVVEVEPIFMMKPELNIKQEKENKENLGMKNNSLDLPILTRSKRKSFCQNLSKTQNR